MIFTGIDPGKRGGLAFIVSLANGPNWGVVGVDAMPIIPGRKKSRDEYDLVAIRDWLRRRMERASIFVTVEKSQPLPPKFGGGIANYQRGCSTGWAWMLTALSIPYQLVAPRTWQKVMHAGTSGADTKQRSIIAAQRLFPHVDLRRSEKSRKLDDGLADALLLAEYGRRTRKP